MGSSQSTSNTEDPWWPIENNDFILEQPTNNLLNNNNNNNLNENNTIKIKENENLNNNSLNNTENLSDQSVNENQISNLTDKISVKQLDKFGIQLTEEVEEAVGGISTICNKVEKNSEQRQSLEEFKEELRVKRMARQNATDDLRSEISRLKIQLTEERELNRRLRNGDESCKITTKDIAIGTNYDDFNDKSEIQNSIVNNDKVKGLQSELAEIQFSLQLSNAENLSLTTELDIARKQVISLKDVITCSKQVIEVREEQVNQLKSKLREIENSLAERETKILSDDLRKEYDKQLENIRNLRQLYEERARVSAAERENLERQISIKKDELSSENEKNKHLQEKISTLETDLQNIENDMEIKKSECSRYLYENRELRDEMAVINKLFSQTLMGFNGTNCLDIDRLTTMLEENRSLLNEMATKETNYEGASLPKLLFELVKQANNTNELIDSKCLSSSPKLNTKEFLNDESSLSDIERISNEIIVKSMEGNEKLVNYSDNNVATSVETPFINIIDDEKNEIEKVASVQEIIGNLPKVWKVLIELLNHQKINKVEIIENGQSEDCYKSVQTPNGPKAEISVSKTYIKLKDLILEKKSLLKETTRLKTLNSHLENRLNSQEKRLSMVSLELTKTWHLVGKMQRQHRQLHTHEQILRYQLQQKRRLLNELKEELEYCRRKWAAARAKNEESQLQCNDMRREFAKRKLQDANNSAESGYSDGPGSDEDDNIDSNVNISKRSYEQLFINDKKIERLNSTTPIASKLEGYFRRCQSVPTNMMLLDNIVQTVASEKQILNSEIEGLPPSGSGLSKNGAIPKQFTKKVNNIAIILDRDSNGATSEDSRRTERSHRINRLEEQCKSLIAQVLETSNCREKLEIQLCRFQDEMSPAQHPIPLEEFIAKKRHSKSPSPNNDADIEEKSNDNGLTAREVEYTRKRSERIQRLENESRLLMSKIKKTTARGNNMKSLLDHIHARCISSREGSFDSNLDDNEKPTEDISATDDASKVEDSTTEDELTENNNQSSDGAIEYLTSNEEGYTHRRSERLRRLEEESKNLLARLAKNSEHGTKLNRKLNYLHTKYGSEDSDIDTPHTSQNVETVHSQSDETTVESRLKVVDEASVKRSERLKLLEEESKKLLTKLSNTSERGTEMLDRLDENRKRKDEAIRKKEEDKLREKNEKLEIEESVRLLVEEQNVAMSSIVPEQISEFAIITQTASQIAQSRGAKPKLPPPKPTGIAALQLSCSKKTNVVKIENQKHEETLEEMFLRLSGGAVNNTANIDKDIHDVEDDQKDKNTDK